tara:strand:+ start:718 stop:1140 length:423 start_codon:yes stop_codon:yes gene_type:complete
MIIQTWDDNDERKCRSCQKVKPILEFPTAGIKKNRQYRRRICNTCYVKNKNHYRVKQRAWLNKYKSELSCEKCGYSSKTHRNFTTSALQFHHPRADKEFEVSNGAHRGMSKEKILSEINKCVVLCCRCHAEIHFNPNNEV